MNVKTPCFISAKLKFGLILVEKISMFYYITNCIFYLIGFYSHVWTSCTKVEMGVEKYVCCEKQ